MTEAMKRKKIYRYDRKTGMTVWGALPGWCFAAAMFISVALAPETMSENVKAGFVVVSVLFLIVDILARIVHYVARRQNEQVELVGQVWQAEQDEQGGQDIPPRYVSLTEKATYWIIKILPPLYIVPTAIAAILLNL